MGFTMAEFARALQTQNIWFAAQQYKDAEAKLVRQRLGLGDGDASAPASSAPATPVESKASAMISELKKELNDDSLESMGDVEDMLNRVTKLEQENNEIKAQLQAALARLDQLEASSTAAPVAAKPAAPVAAAAAKEESEIVMDGLVWGSVHELKPLAFGIFKLVITAIIEDEKVSSDDLTEKIEDYEDEVQSVDIA